MRHEIVGKVTRPRRSSGVDWGGDVYVVARLGDRELWQTPGVTLRYTVGSEYFPRRLVLVDRAEGHWRDSLFGAETELREGGRLTRSAVAAHADRIDEFFGGKVSHLITPGKTLILEDDGK